MPSDLFISLLDVMNDTLSEIADDRKSSLEQHNSRRIKRMLRRIKSSYRKHGRTFLNVICQYLDEKLLGNNTNYLMKPSLKIELNRFKIFCQSETETTLNIDLFVIDARCSYMDKKVIARKLGTVNERKNWFEWNDYIVNTCIMLNEQYPHYFCQAIKEQLDYIDPLLLNKVELRTVHEPYHELYGVYQNLPQRRPSTSCDPEDWKSVLARVETIKTSGFCGIMFGVLDNWLIQTTTSMNRAFPESIPNYWPAMVQARKDMRLKTLTENYEPIQDESVRNCRDIQKKSVMLCEENETLKDKKDTSAFSVLTLPNRYNAFSSYYCPRLT